MNDSTPANDSPVSKLTKALADLKNNLNEEKPAWIRPGRLAELRFELFTWFRLKRVDAALFSSSRGRANANGSGAPSKQQIASAVHGTDIDATLSPTPATQQTNADCDASDNPAVASLPAKQRVKVVTLANALCEVLLARDQIAAQAEELNFKDITLQTLGELDRDIYKYGYEVYLREPINFAAWRHYLNIHPGQEDHKSKGDAKDKPNESKRGWWWYIDHEQGHQLRHVVFWGLYIWRAIIGIVAIYICCHIAYDGLGTTLPSIARFITTFLKSQNLSFFSVLNENTIALATVLITLIAIAGRIAFLASQRAADTFNLILAQVSDKAVEITKASRWWRARIVSLFSVSPLFMSVILFLVFMILVNSYAAPAMQDWSTTAQNTPCLNIDDAKLVADVEGNQSILANAGNCARMVGLRDEARTTYQAVLQNDPNCLAALRFLADIYLDEENAIAAMPLIDRGLSRIRPLSDAVLHQNFVSESREDDLLNTCVIIEKADDAMLYDYRFRILQVRALILQGAYSSARLVMKDLWQQVTNYDHDPATSTLFDNRAEPDPNNNSDARESGVSTAEMSYYYALILELTVVADPLLESPEMRKKIYTQWDFVIFSTNNADADSDALMWLNDAYCFEQGRGQRGKVSDGCVARKQQLLKTGQ
jgi:hypothetical protein